VGNLSQATPTGAPSRSSSREWDIVGVAHCGTNGSAGVSGFHTLRLITVSGVVNILGLFGSLALPK
jgi:hypothetical protein